MNAEQLSVFIADEHTKLAEAMHKIDENGNGILFVTDKAGSLIGTVSDGDIRRWILKAGNLESEISNLMNPKPKYVTGESVIDNPLEFMTGLHIRALPVVDANGHIINIFLAKELENASKDLKGGLENVSVVVMAGGKGTRLYPYTKILPKPLIPIGDVPIVERIFDNFHNYGIIDFIMTVNYKKSIIKSYFAEIKRDYEIEYVDETLPLGTAGGLRLINRNFNIPIIVTNCDTLIRIDYKKLYDYHLESGNEMTIVTAMKNDQIPYGVIYSKENGEIDYIDEKPTRSYLINAGMYIINPGLIKLIPEQTFFHMTDLMDKTMKEGLKVGMYPISENNFLDMGEFAEMKRMEEMLNEGDIL